jgi:purine-nucleoside phosphorylase
MKNPANRLPAGYEAAREAVRYLQAHWRVRPRVAITLGTGLADVAKRLKTELRIPYKLIPHFPRPSVFGHGGALHLGVWKGVPVALMEGRAHLYEGLSPAEVVFPVRVMALAGTKVFVLTCAAGGIAPQAKPGSFMIFADHFNLQGASPLAGAHDARWGERFVDMTEAYDPGLRRLASQAAAKLRLKCLEGVYASLLGPSYETPAEIRALRRLGAEAVGMSTVPEALAIRQAGCRLLALATITNRAAGLTRKTLTHEEVLAVGRAASRNLAALLEVLLPQLVP